MEGYHDHWKDFVQEHLLKYGVIDGIILTTKRGEAIYSHGKMNSIDQSKLGQFVQMFSVSTEEQELAACKRGFVLYNMDGKSTHYKVYHKMPCSAYCTSGGNSQGLLVCNLPYGVLVASHPAQQTNTMVINIVERACQLLRA
ncbi:uncharacterized protein LOC116611844 [Nematostella vectensis]|uniref:uncharacterized protein LOC116611844 n=1 Tax=Nematostella vectensis TaxID=45351 RepID=UPI00207760A6|nr:uncharacterized protein LOC116611844 [Nematostella vectensis]